MPRINTSIDYTMELSKVSRIVILKLRYNPHNLIGYISGFRASSNECVISWEFVETEYATGYDHNCLHDHVSRLATVIYLCNVEKVVKVIDATDLIHAIGVLSLPPLLKVR